MAVTVGILSFLSFLMLVFAQEYQLPEQIAPTLYVNPSYYPTDADYCSPTDNDPDGDCIVGRAGQDYPTYAVVPRTSFTCESQQYPGIYADTEAYCQVFHFCQFDGRADSFLCPNGTLFNQENFVCEWWHNVDCSQATNYYHLNAFLYKEVHHEPSKQHPPTPTGDHRAPPSGHHHHLHPDKEGSKRPPTFYVPTDNYPRREKEGGKRAPTYYVPSSGPQPGPIRPSFVPRPTPTGQEYQPPQRPSYPRPSYRDEPASTERRPFSADYAGESSQQAEQQLAPQNAEQSAEAKSSTVSPYNAPPYP